MGQYKNVYVGRFQMQNRTDFVTLCFSTPQPNMDVSSQQHHNKSSQMHQIWDEQFLQISGLFSSVLSFPSIAGVDKWDQTEVIKVL